MTPLISVAGLLVASQKSKVGWPPTSSNLTQRKLNSFGLALDKLSRIHIDSLTVNSASIQIDSQATDLGVILDNHLSLLPHIRNVSKSCFFQLRQLWSIRRRITTSVAKGLAQAFVCCRLDYCNSSLYGATGKNLWHLQSILHTAARMVVGRRKFDHITPALRDELHWLPVAQRIDFKLCTLTYKCLHGMAPAYLSSMCVPTASDQFRSRLRSAPRGDLIIPVTRTALGSRSFASAGPRTWNKLPVELRNCSLSLDRFRAKLKAHFFKIAYF